MLASFSGLSGVLYVDSRWWGVCIKGCVFNSDPRASLTLQHPPSCVRSMFDFTMLNLFNIWDSVTWMWIGSRPMNLFNAHSMMCLLNKRFTRSLMHPWFMSDLLLDRLVLNLFDQFVRLYTRSLPSSFFIITFLLFLPYFSFFFLFTFKFVSIQFQVTEYVLIAYDSISDFFRRFLDVNLFDKYSIWNDYFFL